MSHKYYQGEEWWIDDNWSPSVWEKYDVVITGNGCHTISGKRLHVVPLLNQQVPLELSNSLVVTEKYFNEHFKEKESDT